MIRWFVPALVILACLVPEVGTGAPITLSGTVTYAGPYNGDTLYVALVDTSAADSGPFVILAFDVGSSPLSQPFSFNLDSSTAPPVVWLAALLDVDGGGTGDLSSADVLGWYPSTPVVAEVSTATSHSGLDFALPTSEIRGTVTFVPGQETADLFVLPESQCPAGSGPRFAPSISVPGTGPYTMHVYAGAYCLYARGSGIMPDRWLVCYGDYTCESPGLITVGEDASVNGINISFINPVPVESTTWGTLKSRYP